MAVVELTTFTVRADRTSAMLAARPGMVEAFRRDRRGFVDARLIRVAEDTWLDVVEWTDDLAWDESKAKGANQPEIAAFFGTIDELVSSERGVRYDDGRRAVRTVAYGPHPSQVGELYLPDGDGPFPVIVLIHGGYWTALWDRRAVVPLAEALVRDGYAVWSVEYRRIGEDGGGWPGTFEDVEAAVDALADLDAALDLSRVQVVGHSAGGQLAVWVAGRDEAKVPVIKAVSLAGPLDVVAAEADRLGTDLADPEAQPPVDAPAPNRPEVADVVAELAKDGVLPVLFGGTRAEVPERYERAVRPISVPLLEVLGDEDDVIPVRYAAHPSAEFVEVKGANHFHVIDPSHATYRVVRDWLA